MSVADPHRVVLTGENPFLRLSEKDGDPNSTDASYWRILFCPAGPGHVLYLKSELTHGHWRIYSDNIRSSMPISASRATRATSGPSMSRRPTPRSRSPGTISAIRC